MIYDKIDNLESYAGISTDMRMGLEWLRDVSLDIEKGVYMISPQVKAIVSEYTTKELNENGYEAHRDWIDIQYLVKGEERVRCLPLEYLTESLPYNESIDASFCIERGIKGHDLVIGSGYFAVFFPQDGHMPGLMIGGPEKVKKVVVKVAIH